MMFMRRLGEDVHLSLSIHVRLPLTEWRGIALGRRQGSKVTKTRKRVFIIWSVLAPLLAVAPGAHAFTQEEVNKVLTTKQCPFCDLTGAQLTGTDLSGGRLSGARLSNANLSKANLAGDNLRNADLRHAQLLDANLSNADLSGADLANADLAGASLVHAKLSGTDLSEAKLSGTDFSEADLSGAYWTDGKKCKEGSIGECKEDSGQSQKAPRRGRGSHGGMQGVPGGQ